MIILFYGFYPLSKSNFLKLTGTDKPDYDFLRPMITKPAPTTIATAPTMGASGKVFCVSAPGLDGTEILTEPAIAAARVRFKVAVLPVEI